MPVIRRNQHRTRHTVLRPREALLLDNAQGTVITVERGCLWVTLERDPRDIVLDPGMRFQIDRPGRTIVAAETDTALRLAAPVNLREWFAAQLGRAVAALLDGWAGRLSRRVVPHF